MTMRVLSNFAIPEQGLKAPDTRLASISNEKLQELLGVLLGSRERYLGPHLWPCMLADIEIRKPVFEGGRLNLAFGIHLPPKSSAGRQIVTAVSGSVTSFFAQTDTEIILTLMPWRVYSATSDAVIVKAQDAEEKKSNLVFQMYSSWGNTDLGIYWDEETEEHPVAERHPIVKLTIPDDPGAYKAESWIQKVQIGKAPHPNAQLLLAALPSQNEENLGRLILYFASDSDALGFALDN